MSVNGLSVSSRLMCLNAWSPDSCALLGGLGASGMWGLCGVSSSLEVVFDI